MKIGCEIYKSSPTVLIPKEERITCYMPFWNSGKMYFGGCYDGWVAPWCNSPFGTWGICDPACNQGINVNIHHNF